MMPCLLTQAGHFVALWLESGTVDPGVTPWHETRGVDESVIVWRKTRTVEDFPTVVKTLQGSELA